MSRLLRLAAVVAAAAVLVCASGCGGGNESVVARTPNELTPEQIDADPISLLPSAPVALGTVDARAFFASPTLGPQIARLTEKLVPIGDEAGFRASRDVDRIYAASYSTQGVDLCAVVKGKFDAKKIDDVAKKHEPTKAGGVLVASSYAGRTVYTVDNVGFTVLTEHTALAGTETGIRRALDRMRDGLATTRGVPQWMVDAVETKGAATAVAADLASQDLSRVAASAIDLKWLKGLQKVRVIGNFGEPGMHLAGSLTYLTPEQAGAGADGVKDLARIVGLLAVAGIVPKIVDLDVTTEKTSTEFKFAIDDQALRSLLAAATSAL